MQKLFLYITILLLIIGCASKARKNAEMYMKHQKYELAHPLWIQVLKKDPDDGEARLAKDMCEREIMGNRLISLRDLIIAKNINQALSMARSISDFKKKWGIQSDYNGAQFESKELRRLFPSYLKLLKSQVSLNKNLMALDLYAKNKNLFIGFDQDKQKEVHTLINKNGVKKCKQYKKNLDKYNYYDLYAHRYCQAFNENIKIKGNFAEELFSDVSMKLNIKNLSTPEQSLFTSALKKDFKNTVWYHPEGKHIADYTGNGSYRFKKKMRPVTKVHQYTVKVPYIVEKKVKNKNGVEEIKKVTKYRKQTKNMKYNATEVNTSYYISLTANLNLFSHKLPISFLESDSEIDFESNIILPAIGLKPHRANNKNTIQYIKLKSQDYVKKVHEDLSHSWRKKYCLRNSHNGSKQLFIENVIRCLRLEGPENKFVNNWFIKETGLNATDAMSYLNIEHSKK